MRSLDVPLLALTVRTVRAALPLAIRAVARASPATAVFPAATAAYPVETVVYPVETAACRVGLVVYRPVGAAASAEAGARSVALPALAQSAGKSIPSAT